MTAWVTTSHDQETCLIHSVSLCVSIMTETGENRKACIRKINYLEDDNQLITIKTIK